MTYHYWSALAPTPTKLKGYRRKVPMEKGSTFSLFEPFSVRSFFPIPLICLFFLSGKRLLLHFEIESDYCHENSLTLVLNFMKRLVRQHWTITIPITSVKLLVLVRTWGNKLQYFIKEFCILLWGPLFTLFGFPLYS